MKSLITSSHTPSRVIATDCCVLIKRNLPRAARQTIHLYSIGGVEGRERKINIRKEKDTKKRRCKYFFEDGRTNMNEHTHKKKTYINSRKVFIY